MPDLLVGTFQESLVELGNSVADELEAGFRGLGSWNRDDIDRFVEQVAPLIAASTTTAVNTQAALVAYLLNGIPLPIDPNPIIRARVERLSQPFTSMWHALGEERDFNEALDAGASSAQGLGLDSVLQSARDAMGILGAAAGVKQYMRVADGNACNWCAALDGDVYATADAGSLGHDRCACSLVPDT